MKNYSTFEAFDSNRNTTRDKKSWSTFYKGHEEFCLIYGIKCIAYTSFCDKTGKSLKPNDSSTVDHIKYFFRFDPSTKEEYIKYYELCSKWNNPDWIVLS